MEEYGIYDLIMAFGSGVLLMGIGFSARALNWLALVGVVFILGSLIQSFHRFVGFLASYWHYAAIAVVLFVVVLLVFIASFGRVVTASPDGVRAAKRPEEVDASLQPPRKKFDEKIAADNLKLSTSSRTRKLQQREHLKK